MLKTVLVSDIVHQSAHRFRLIFGTKVAFCHSFAGFFNCAILLTSTDFVKNRVGVEVQFGKYSFMVYNVCAKMTIFHKMDVIDVGVEIVPVKKLADEMSTGVSYFEQFVWDLEHRGIADIDIPVLILGVTA